MRVSYENVFRDADELADFLMLDDAEQKQVLACLAGTGKDCGLSLTCELGRSQDANEPVYA